MHVQEKPQKRSPLAFCRGRSLKRRVDEHVATYDTVANVQVAKPPFPRSAVSLATLLTPNDPCDVRRHQSKLSKSRTMSASPLVEFSPASSSAAASAQPNAQRRAPPPPAPIFSAVLTSAPLALDTPAHTDPAPNASASPNVPPPVAGMTRPRLFRRASESRSGVSRASEPDAEKEDGGVKGKGDPARRNRTRTNSLKKGLQGTVQMRALPLRSQVPAAADAVECSLSCSQGAIAGCKDGARLGPGLAPGEQSAVSLCTSTEYHLCVDRAAVLSITAL